MMKLDTVGEIPVDPGIWLQKIKTLYLLVRSQRDCNWRIFSTNTTQFLSYVHEEFIYIIKKNMKSQKMQRPQRES